MEHYCHSVFITAVMYRMILLIETVPDCAAVIIHKTETDSCPRF